MVRYARRAAVFEAARFDGTPESGMACARFAGAAASLTIDDDEVVLRLGRRKVEPGYWLLRRASVSMMAPEEFEREFLALDVPRAAPGPEPTVRAPRGDIGEGDKVIDVTDPEQNELEVLDVEGDTAIVDGPWGEKIVPLANLRKVA